MGSEEKYPRKGEFGSTKGRCHWCGKDSAQHWGMYCSRKCAAAGSFYTTICLTVVAVTFVIWSLTVFNIPGLVFFGVMSCLFVYYSYAGIRMRMRNSSTYRNQ